ncbi:MAG: hypothetical protein ACE5Q6_08490 [Dehalococcoidia bacterium]
MTRILRPLTRYPSRYAVLLIIVLAAVACTQQPPTPTPESTATPAPALAPTAAVVEPAVPVGTPAGASNTATEGQPAAPVQIADPLVAPASVGGIVTSVTGGPLVGVEVSIPSLELSIETDSNGFYVLDHIEISGTQPVLLNFRKEGYSFHQIPMDLVPNFDHPGDALLQEIEVIQEVDTAVDTKIMVEDDQGAEKVSLEIKAGTLRDADGNVVTGDVTVEITHGDPFTEAQAFPGGFEASMEAGGARDILLDSLGYSRFTIRGENGEEISDIDPQNPATVVLRLPDVFQIGGDSQGRINVGDTVPLWVYDSEVGSWLPQDADPTTPEMDDAVIIEENGFLMAKGKTSHTSAINADYPIRTEEQDPYLVVTVTDGKGNPMSGVQVRIGVVGTYSGFRANTDAKGQVCRQVPADRNMETQSWWQGDFFPDTPIKFATGPKVEEGDCANPNLRKTIKVGLAAIRGKIVDADGTPIKRARVYANPVDNYWARSGSAMTNDQGEFCLQVKPSTDEEIKKVRVILWSIRYFYLAWYYSTALPKPDPQLPTTSLSHAAEIQVPKALANCKRGEGLNIGTMRPPALKVKSISFKDDHTILDDTPNPFVPLADPSWQDTNTDGKTEKNIPVAYTRQKKVKVDVTFKIDPPLVAPLENSVQVIAKAGNVMSFNSGFTLLTLNPDPPKRAEELTIKDLSAERALSDQVQAFRVPDKPLVIEWKTCYQPCSQTSNSTDAGKSQHSFYATLEDPSQAKKIYLTLLDLSTSAANGARNEDDTIRGIWKPFAARKVHKRTLNTTTGAITNGKQLRYWTPWTHSESLGMVYSCPAIFATVAMLIDGTGRCGAWAPFLVDTFKIHGIFSLDVAVGSKSEYWKQFPKASSTGLGHIAMSSRTRDPRIRMMVKNWRYDATSTGTDPRYPYTIKAITEFLIWKGRVVSTGPAVIRVAEFVDQPGAPGQGNANPPGWFASGDHALVQMVERGAFQFDLFDPSYGTGPFPDTFPKENAIIPWANASLDGFAKVRRVKRTVVAPKLFRWEVLIEASKGLK